MIEIQQHDSVVVEVAAIFSGLRQAPWERRRRTWEREGCARGKGEAPMRLPTIYRGGGGRGPSPLDEI